MKLEEVLPALRSGKKVSVHIPGEVIAEFASFQELALFGREPNGTVTRALSCDGWSIVEEPLTDEQLIAEWERQMRGAALAFGNDSECVRHLRECIRQLRERKL